MKCPRCRDQLFTSPHMNKSFIDICDHVSCFENDSNWMPPLRPVWVCLKWSCDLAHSFDDSNFWDMHGDYYGRGTGLQAIGSLMWKMERKYKRERWLRKNHLNFINRIISRFRIIYFTILSKLEHRNDHKD